MSSAEAARQFEIGLALHREGRAGLAESHYLRTVKLEPGHADAWHLLGVIAFQAGNLPKAIKQFRQALALRPRFAQAWNNLALALKARGDAAGAKDAFAQALAVRPEYVEAAYNLGILHQQAGDAAAAEGAWRQALQWQPAHAPTLTNLGNLLRGAGRVDEAAPLLRRADEEAPSGETALNLGLLALDQGEPQRARALAGEAARRDPALVDARELEGVAARLAEDVDAALAALEDTVAREPQRGGAWFELGLARSAAGDWPGARAALSRGRGLDAKSARLAWHAALALPALPSDEAEVDAALAAFGEGVARLRERVAKASPQELVEHLEAASSVAPFHLAYLPRDPTALLAQFGDLLVSTVARVLPQYAAPPSRWASAGDRRLRIGFVSSYWTRHTVSRYFAGLATGLDRARFEVIAWHTGTGADADSAATAAAVEQFIPAREGVAALAARIREAAPDVLVFPDIGMDPRQQVLAACRLAPRQVALYGHPLTTGLPTIDVFASAAALEPDDADAHYRERLVRLPGLGALPQRWPATPDPAPFRARVAGRPALLCPQNLSKLTPAFDRVLARILAGSDARLFLFDREGPLSRRYLARLARAATLEGVSIEGRVELLGACPYPEFLGALQAADLVLDTPWFSGGGTSLDAFALGVPVLTTRGGFARGRQTAGMLDLMGVEGLIATDDDAYVARALELLRDRDQHRQLGATIAGRADVLFSDPEPVRAFAGLLEQLVATAPP
jgi:predicted O-linked N-acetylglucosamine transferase (SPINDLY family)